MFVLLNPRRSKDDITHQGAAPAEGPEAVVRHVVAGGDVDLPELVAVPGQAVAGVVRQAGAGPEVELVDVGTVPGEHQESVVPHRLKHRERELIKQIWATVQPWNNFNTIPAILHVLPDKELQ